MNILMLSWRGPGHPNSGGAEINTWENVTAWNKAGHNVTWFTSIFPGAKKEEVIQGIKIIRRGSQNLQVNLFAIIWYLFSLHENYDIVIDQIHGLPFFTPLFIKKPILAFIHEVAREVWWLNTWPKPFNYIPGFIGSHIEPWIFRILYKQIPFMTVSNSTKEDLINYGIPASNISVFASGVNLNLPKSLPQKNSIPTITFLGALSKDKGIEDALQSFVLINHKRPTWNFWVIGKSESTYFKKLESFCKQNKIENKVKFWGYVSSQKKFKLLAKSHILINPSIREGWGLVNIEANSVGVPVIGYEVPGTKDSVRNGSTGILCPPRHPELLAENTIDLVENKKKYNKYSNNCIMWSKKFTWEKFTTQSLYLIEKIANKK